MISARAGAPRVWACVATSFIIVGAALRLRGCLSQGQLYVDDARLAVNIASRSLAGLTRPLDYDQLAPIPFLWIEKLLTLVAGVNDLALRAAPLLASIAVLALLWTVGRRAVGERPAAVATCLGALSIFLIGFASTAKQYSVDALVTLLVVWLVLDVLRAPVEKAAWIRLGVGGATAIWLSHPGVLVLAGAGLALPVSTAVRAVPTWWRRYALITSAWAVMFSVLYFLVDQAGERDAYMRSYWGWTFLSPDAPDFWARAGRAARAMLVPPIWRGDAFAGTPLLLRGVTCLAFLAGLVSILRARGASIALLCVGPYIAVTGAALLAKYPPVDRFLLFATPLLLFIYASAICWTAEALTPRAPEWIVATALVLFTLWGYPNALEHALHPERRRETTALLRTIETRAPDAPVYLFASGAWYDGSVWSFYTTDWKAPDTMRLRRFADLWRRGVAATIADAPPPTDTAGMSSQVGRHQELIGTGARIRYVREGIARSPVPDAGWVEAESDRIWRAANPIAWVWATEMYPENAIASLLRGLRQRGGRLIFASRVLGATAWEVEFTSR